MEEPEKLNYRQVGEPDASIPADIVLMPPYPEDTPLFFPQDGFDLEEYMREEYWPEGKCCAPEQFDLDAMYPQVPYKQFYNNKAGCCVISSQANAQMFYLLKQKKGLIVPSEDDCRVQYFKLTGGKDSGLRYTVGLNAWKNQGWSVGGKILKIESYSKLKTKDAFRAAVATGYGIHFGFNATRGDMNAFASAYLVPPKDRVWRLTDYPANYKDKKFWETIVGGHAMYCGTFFPDKVKFRTWGTFMYATWAWVAKRAIEMYVCNVGMTYIPPRDINDPLRPFITPNPDAPINNPYSDDYEEYDWYVWSEIYDENTNPTGEYEWVLNPRWVDVTGFRIRGETNCAEGWGTSTPTDDGITGEVRKIRCVRTAVVH